MKLGELIGISELMKKLFEHTEFTAKANHRIGKFQELAMKEYQDYEKSRQLLFEKMGEDIETIDPETDTPKKDKRIKPEFTAQFQKELQELFEEELEWAIKPIAINEIEGLKLTPIETCALINLGIVEDDDDEDVVVYTPK